MKRDFLSILVCLCVAGMLLFPGCSSIRGQKEDAYDMPAPKLSAGSAKKRPAKNGIMQTLRDGQSPEAQGIADDVDSYFGL